MRPIYLDYNATTPVDPEVLQAMLPYLTGLDSEGNVDLSVGVANQRYGNPSSGHAYGKAARDAVGHARRQVADLIGAEPDEVVFTGGGSEASNLAIKGVAFPDPAAVHVVTTAVEHPATARPVDFLRRLGAAVTVLAADRFGQIDPADVAAAITPRTRLVSVMHSNNETGTLLPVAGIGGLCRRRGVLVHTDCAQSLGKVPVDVRELGVDLLTVAGHKLYAPKGVGALYVRRGVALEPLVHGAGHEAGRRAGTENVPYIVGLGAAAEIARRSLPQETERLRGLRDRLHQRLRAALGDRLVLNGHPEHRLPNTLNVSFVGHVGAELLAKAPGVAASTGSACHEGAVKLSPVLAAMGVDPEVGKGAVRLTVGRYTTAGEVDWAAEMLIAAARR